MRRGEIAALEWRHVDLNARTIAIRQSIPMNQDGVPVVKAPKTRKSTRTIAIPGMMVDALESYRNEWSTARSYSRVTWPGEYLFCHESGQPHDPHWLTDKWIELRRKHGLKEIRFHDLRHTAATWMIKQNVHPKAIAARLGHVNIKTTMDVYGHVIESVDRAAAEVFDAMPSTLGRGAVVKL
jgi:integrase